MIVSDTGYFTRNQLFSRRLLVNNLLLTSVVQLPNDFTVVLDTANL